MGRARGHRGADQHEPGGGARLVIIRIATEGQYEIADGDLASELSNIARR